MADNIVHTDGDFYILDAGKSWEVWRNNPSGAGAVRRASIGKTIPNAWDRVKSEIEKRKVSDPGVKWL